MGGCGRILRIRWGWRQGDGYIDAGASAARTGETVETAMVAGGIREPGPSHVHFDPVKQSYLRRASSQPTHSVPLACFVSNRAVIDAGCQPHA